MRRETAYKLAGRRHRQPALGTGLEKMREVRFKELPRGQIDRAWSMLCLMKGLQVERSTHPLYLILRYSVVDHSLQEIEAMLRTDGFVLDDGLYSKLVRALIYFSEETQRHNLESPERLIKQSHEVYVQAWDQQPVHGDHDATPHELRDYK